MTSRLLTLKTETTLITEECCNCGVLFAMPTAFKAQRLKDKAWFYCPAGHSQQYTENEADRLRAELEKAQDGQRRLERDRALLREHNDELLAANRKKDKEMAAVKRRAAAGVCTECHRHFVNVESHYINKHAPKEVRDQAASKQRAKKAP